MRRLLRRRAVADERGIALVEFALVVPMLLLLIVGTLDFARAVNAYLTINSAVREGARAVALDSASTPDQITRAVASRSAPLDPQLLRVTATYDDRGAPGPIRVRVEASYPWTAVTWIAGGFFSGGTGSLDLTAAATVEARR